VILIAIEWEWESVARFKTKIKSQSAYKVLAFLAIVAIAGSLVKLCTGNFIFAIDH
jgi:hypothetical protein